MRPMHLQSLKLLSPKVKEEMQSQANTLFDLWTWQGHKKYCPAPSTSFDLCTCKVWSCFVQRIRSRCIYRKCSIWPRSWLLPSTLYIMRPMFQVWCYYVQRFRSCIYMKIQYLTFDHDLVLKVTWNVGKYPLHHVTYAAVKCEVAICNGLGGDAFTRKYMIWPSRSRSNKM